jgi:hypothetical protein
MLVAQCSTSEDVHQRILRAARTNKLNYHRLNPPLPEAVELDTTDVAKLLDLCTLTRNYLQQPAVTEQIDAIVKLVLPPPNQS